jgi:hypothetical protein
VSSAELRVVAGLVPFAATACSSGILREDLLAALVIANRIRDMSCERHILNTPTVSVETVVIEKPDRILFFCYCEGFHDFTVERWFDDLESLYADDSRPIVWTTMQC